MCYHTRIWLRWLESVSKVSGHYEYENMIQSHRSIVSYELREKFTDFPDIH